MQSYLVMLWCVCNTKVLAVPSFQVGVSKKLREAALVQKLGSSAANESPSERHTLIEFTFLTVKLESCVPDQPYLMRGVNFYTQTIIS